MDIHPNMVELGFDPEDHLPEPVVRFPASIPFLFLNLKLKAG